MSDRHPDQDTNAVPKGDGCVLALLMAVGIGLLLPGLCAFVFALSVADELFNDASIAMLWVVSLAAGAGGVVLLARARRMAGYPQRRDES